MATYNANSGEFQVNTTTFQDQEAPSATALSNGAFVAVWHSDDQDGSGDGIYGQRYNASGDRVGSEFRVNTSTAGDQEEASVTALSDGGFVVTWESFGQDGSGDGIFGQRYNASGAPVGSEFRVNTNTAGNQELASVAALSAGSFVVTWESFGQDGSGDGIFGQRYNASGARVGNEFQINTSTTGSQELPSVAALSNGGFVVTWQSFGQDGSEYGIYAQLYNASGNVVGSEFKVNTNTSSGQEEPSVTALNDGGFVVTWHSDDLDGSSDGIFGQRYSASGALVGVEFQINTFTTGDQEESRVAALDDGGFVVTWMSFGQDGSNEGIYGQRFNASGNLVGSEFQVNTYTTSIQEDSSVSALSDGGFVVTWESFGQDGSSNGIFGQRYHANGTPCRDFTGTSAADTWTGGDGRDIIDGREGNDTLIGLAGNDSLTGGGGVDTMAGGLGNDIYYVNSAGDNITEEAGAGTDTVFSSVTRPLGANQEKLILTGTAAINGTGNGLNNTLTGNGAANSLDGMAGNDILLGKLGNDVLVGRAGNDTLSGGGNNDLLFGRGGNDTLTGGGSADTFVFDCALNAITNNDLITDFSHADDTIRLDKTIFTKFTIGTLLSSQFRASTTGTALDRNDFFLYNTSSGAILYDADGSGAGAAIQFATLTNQPQNVAFNDFVVVA